MSKREGFTIIEVIIAIVVFGVGVLALASSSGVITRMVNRGEDAEIGTGFGAERLERLRMTGCASQAAGGPDTLKRGGGGWYAINTWSFVDAGNNTWRISVNSRYKTERGRDRTETLGTSISCNF
ncbi:MAG TPA: prepilin-type N-terminal cleavage/methylation domain-containing protein [Gemmatimonadales bacterium]|nr:prepilin-type N-terminal cleavage/methylation domain-containing protein [Gemmatimonadales bacterium]